MTDRQLLDDMIAKLCEMEDELSMARLETTHDSLLADRVRRLSLLAFHIRSGLEKAKEAEAELLPKSDEETRRRA